MPAFAIDSTPKSVSPTWQFFRDAFRRHPTAIAGGAVLLYVHSAFFDVFSALQDEGTVAGFRQPPRGLQSRRSGTDDDDGTAERFRS
jgi:hypothetical protein